MAARTNPSKGNKPDKLFRDALMLAIRREHKTPDGIKTSKISAIAAKLVEKAIDGSEAAITLIRDSVDGKPAQSIGLGQAADLEPIETTARPPMTRKEWLATHGS